MDDFNTNPRVAMKRDNSSSDNPFGRQAMPLRAKISVQETQTDRPSVKEEDKEEMELSDVSYTTDEDLGITINTEPTYGMKPPSGSNKSIIDWAKRLLRGVGSESSLEARQLQIAISKNEDRKSKAKERRRQKRQEKRQETAAA